MASVAKIKEGAPPRGLELLRQPFPEHQISKLPKETKAQREAREKDRSLIVWNCPQCGGYHHKNAVHLDYVGHAALTDRLLDCDPEWSWEPCTLPGLPNPGNGMWITLTVCGVSRIGYGAADGKSGGDAVKEIIGDALRNAAMRFGAALDLWHKGDLHAEEGETGGHSKESAVSPPSADYAWPEGPATGITMLKAMVRELWRDVNACGDEDSLTTLLAEPSTKFIMAQCEALENPAHREIWAGDGGDNPGLFAHIQKRRAEFATRNLNAG